MNFTKMHGAVNDFVLVEANDVQRDWQRWGSVLCARNLVLVLIVW